MNDAAIDSLIAELGGPGVLERCVAWFEPSFHPECGVLLTRDDSGWKGWWIATLRVTRGDPVLGWLDPTTSREPLPLDDGAVQELAQTIRTALLAAPAKPTGIILDGCMFHLEFRSEGKQSARSAHLNHRGEDLVRSLATDLCDLADAGARWDATRSAFASLRDYIG